MYIVPMLLWLVSSVSLPRRGAGGGLVASLASMVRTALPSTSLILPMAGAAADVPIVSWVAVVVTSVRRVCSLAVRLQHGIADRVIGVLEKVGHVPTSDGPWHRVLGRDGKVARGR